MNADDALISPDTAPDAPKGVGFRRTRSLAAAARARVANSWLRLGSCAIVAAVSVSILGNFWPAYWFTGLVVVVLIDRALYARLAAQCARGEPPPHLIPLTIWTVAQGAYGNIVAIMLWSAPYVHGETLAVTYFCGGLANAAVTLRASSILSAAGTAPTIAFMLALPILDFVSGGADNALDLMPLVGGLLLLGFGVNIWRALLASDVAQAEAEFAAIRERQAAAAAAAAKSDAISRMNSELRTPMAALAGAAEHLHRVAATPAARAHIATLVQASEVLKLVLDDLSDLDKLENGQVRIEAKADDPREVLRSVTSAFKAAAQDKQLELFVDVSADIPPLVEMDAARVRQILFNLLANAIRYTTHGGVRVRLAAQPALREGVARLVFTIADTGVGLSRSQLAAVFARGRVASAGEGPGLGLAISLRLARLMNGHLTAKSELGEGSVFSFTLEAPVVSARGGAAA
ncbi:MAG: HAMP domain-containing histidine kinase [Caulobacterales bacterium]|nr:HAMP domain-containing histidine kinase [Caulobacterales bacterium]